MNPRPLQERLLALFQDSPEEVKKVIAETIEVEQEYLSMKVPRGVVDKIQDIVDKVVKNEARQH